MARRRSRLTNTWKARRQVGQMSRQHDGFDIVRDSRTTICRSRRNPCRLVAVEEILVNDMYILNSKLEFLIILLLKFHYRLEILNLPINLL